MTIPMTVEAFTAVLLRNVPALALVALIWLVTFAWYIPVYSRFARGEASALRRLIAWNWVRTLAWTGRAALLLWITAGRLSI